jgi:hypothetical protein
MDDHREVHSLHLPHLINYVVPVVQHKHRKRASDTRLFDWLGSDRQVVNRP